MATTMATTSWAVASNSNSPKNFKEADFLPQSQPANSVSPLQRLSSEKYRPLSGRPTCLGYRSPDIFSDYGFELWSERRNPVAHRGNIPSKLPSLVIPVFPYVLTNFSGRNPRQRTAEQPSLLFVRERTYEHFCLQLTLSEIVRRSPLNRFARRYVQAG